MNFSATNAAQVRDVFTNAIKRGLVLDNISMEKSMVCRPGSDCWDLKVVFFNPSRTSEQAKHVYRFTIDVSDVLPVTVGKTRRLRMSMRMSDSFQNLFQARSTRVNEQIIRKRRNASIDLPLQASPVIRAGTSGPQHHRGTVAPLVTFTGIDGSTGHACSTCTCSTNSEGECIVLAADGTLHAPCNKCEALSTGGVRWGGGPLRWAHAFPRFFYS